jgi:hypothetical protein
MRINLFLLIAFYILLSSAAFGAEREISIHDVLKKMKNELQLSSEQETLIKPILKESLSYRQEIYEKYSSDAIFNKKAFKTEMLKFKEDENRRLSKVLTPEQMKKLLQKQRLKESLNKDQIDFSDGITSGVGLSAQGGSMAF